MDEMIIVDDWQGRLLEIRGYLEAVLQGRLPVNYDLIYQLQVPNISFMLLGSSRWSVYCSQPHEQDDIFNPQLTELLMIKLAFSPCRTCSICCPTCAWRSSRAVSRSSPTTRCCSSMWPPSSAPSLPSTPSSITRCWSHVIKIECLNSAFGSFYGPPCPNPQRGLVYQKKLNQ